MREASGAAPGLARFDFIAAVICIGMGKCFDRACSHRSERHECKFLRFPKSPSRRKKWLTAMNRADEDPKTAYVCSCHFPSGSRLRTPQFGKVLKKSQSRNETTAISSTPSPWKVTCVSREMCGNLVKHADCEFSCRAPIKSRLKEILAVGTKESRKQNINRPVNRKLDMDSLKNPNESTPNASLILGDLHNSFTTENVDNGNDESIEQSNFTKEDSSVSLSPSMIEEQQRLLEEVQRLAAEREVDRQYFDFLTTEREALHNEVSLLQNIKKAHSLDFSCSAVEKVVLFLKCKELEELLQKCEAEKRASELQQHILSQRVHQLESDISDLKSNCEKKQLEINEVTFKNVSLMEKLDEMSSKSSQIHHDLNGMLKVSEVLKRENKQLKQRVAHASTSFKFSTTCNDQNISHYCGLPNVNTFYWLLSMIPQKLNYFSHSKVECLSREDQLFLTLVKLRQNVSHYILMDLFHVSKFTVTNVVNTFVSALHTVLVRGLMKRVPSLRKVQKCMPEAFKKYPNCRMIIDCTEVEVQVPKLMSNRNKIYSNYKSRCTFKGLIGIAPNGTVVFTSKLFPGSTSDNVVVQESGILKIFEPGDAVMADKGFTISKMLPPGVTLNIPPFKETPQFTHGQVIETLEIARSRIHVERAIQRVKTFRILDFIPHHSFPFASDIFQVCAALCNFGTPLIKEVEELMRM